MGLSEYQRKRAELIQNGRPLPQKKQYKIPAKSAKRIAKEKEEKERLGGDDTELVRFFKSAMKRMTGHCSECHARTETHVYKYAIFSICHLLDKRSTVAPSVACHPCNWIELCPDHHTMFDNQNWEERESWGIWPTVRDKLIMVYPDLAPEERRHFPDSVLLYMEKLNPF